MCPKENGQTRVVTRSVPSSLTEAEGLFSSTEKRNKWDVRLRGCVVAAVGCDGLKWGPVLV